jgi:hypothetical protein
MERALPTWKASTASATISNKTIDGLIKAP